MNEFLAEFYFTEREKDELYFFVEEKEALSFCFNGNKKEPVNFNIDRNFILDVSN